MNLDLTELVEMAEPQAYESALGPSCGIGQLIIEVLRMSDVMQGRTVDFSETRLVVQQAVQKLDRLDLQNDVAFICGNTHHVDTINGLHDAGHVPDLGRRSLP